MTLGIGNHVIKLGANGEPLKTEQESYIEFVVEGYTSTFSGPTPPANQAEIFDSPAFMRPPLAEGETYFKDGEVYQFALLRKVK